MQTVQIIPAPDWYAFFGKASSSHPLRRAIAYFALLDDGSVSALVWHRKENRFVHADTYNDFLYIGHGRHGE